MLRALAVVVLSEVLVDGYRVKSRSASASEKAASPDCFSPYDGKPMFMVTACYAGDFQAMMHTLQDCTILSDDFDVPPHGSCTEAHVVCSAEVGERLGQRFGGKVAMVQADAGEYYRSMSGSAQSYTAIQGMELSEDFYSEWRDYDARMARIDAAVAASEGAAKLEVVGQSLEGRDMKIVRFTGKGYAPGNPKVVLTFNIHAREWIAGMAGVYAVEKMVEKLKSSPDYLDGTEVVMMPMANPDGFIHSQGFSRFHRKNRNLEYGLCNGPAIWTAGVDLNRNFDAEWASGGSSGFPCIDTYHGPEAGSEPETQAISRVLLESEMTVMIDIHAFSQLILSSPGWTTDSHPREDEFKALGVKMQDAIEARHGNKYTEGPIARTLYAASGSLTDYATKLGALGYCYELQPSSRLWSLLGFAPPASYILPTAEECFDGILVAIDHAKSS